MCPDGFVYNIEVDRHSNYFANGFLVHNCHHATSKSYGRVYEHFAGVPHLGVTATPDRLDMEALGQVYETVAFDYEISDAISDGWLVPIQACTPFIEDLRIDRMRTKAGDLDQAELDDSRGGW
jgi:superfamily II DNA or RNA helicase